MDTKKARQYLTSIGKLLEEHVTAWTVDDPGDGVPMLALTVPSPLAEGAELGYFISLDDVNDALILFDLEITVFTDVSKELFAPLNKFISHLNNTAVIGSFALDEDTTEVIYRNGVLLDGNIASQTAAVNIIRTLTVMENAAVNGGSDIQRLLKGEISADELIAELYDIGGDEV